MGPAVSGDSLFVARWGEGPDVVLLHGLGASSLYWQPLAAASSGYRATAPDLLGFGRSPAPPEASYDVDCHLGALMPQLPRRAVVVAHSTGAILAAALAARHPDRVASLLLVGLPAYPDEEAARRSIGALGLLARLTVDGSPAARWVCETMGRFRPLAIALAPWLVRDLPPSIASDGARHTWPSYSGTLRRVVVATAPSTTSARRRGRSPCCTGAMTAPPRCASSTPWPKPPTRGGPLPTYGSSTATITLLSAGPVSWATPSPRRLMG